MKITQELRIKYIRNKKKTIEDNNFSKQDIIDFENSVKGIKKPPVLNKKHNK